MHIAAASLALLTVPSLAVAHDWPHWRGPARDGVSSETDWLSQGKEQPLWKAELGLGYSTVSVQGRDLATLGHHAESGEDMIVCLDAWTGEVRWEHRFPAEAMANFHGGGTLTTPTFDGDRIYVSQREGKLFCFDRADGAIQWQRDLQTDFEAEPPMYGFAGSPVIMGENLFLSLGGASYCFDKNEGSLRWKTEVREAAGYATLVPFERDGKSWLYDFSGPGLYVLSAEDGSEQAAFPWRSSRGGINAGTPVLYGDQVFISSAYNQGCALLQWEQGGFEEQWASKRMRNKVSGCLRIGDHIYGFDESMLKCLDLRDGSQAWRVRGLGMGAIAAAGDRLLVLSSEGELIVAAADPSGYRELSRRRVLEGGVYWTAPVLANGLIYCRSSLGQFVCMDHRLSEQGIAATVGSLSDSTSREVQATLPAAEDLFAKHLQAVGGAERWNQIESLRLVGEIEITGAGITRTSMSVDMAAPDHWRLRYDLGQYGEVQRGYNGQVGWQIDPFYGDLVFKEDALLELAATRRLREAAEAPELFTSMKTRGTATFADRDCWAVDVVTRAGVPRTVYFDRETGRKLGRSSEREALVRLTDYREFGGLWIPTRQVFLIPDTGAEERMFVQDVVFGESAPRGESQGEAEAEGIDYGPPPAVQRLLWSPERLAQEEARIREAYADWIGTYSGTNGPIELKPQADQLVFAPPGGAAPLGLTDGTEGTLVFARIPGVILTRESPQEGPIQRISFDNRGQVSVLERVVPEEGN